MKKTCDINELRSVAVELDEELADEIPDDLIAVGVEPSKKKSCKFGIIVQVQKASAKEKVPTSFRGHKISTKVVRTPGFAQAS